MTAGELLRQARTAAGLSQRALAERASTSGPAIAAYESGSKEPRFSTVERIVAAAGLGLTAVPAERSGPLMRSRRRSLALAAATAAAIEADPATARVIARRNLSLSAAVVGDNAARRSIDRWADVIEGPLSGMRETLLDPSEQGDDMRQMSPFEGLLTDQERRAAVAAADVTPFP